MRLLLAAATAAAALGCGSADSSMPPQAVAATAAGGAAPPAGAIVVDTATVDLPLALPSHLYVEHDAVVAARSSGVVESVLADLGTRVEAGQLLAKLESADQEIALDQAEEARSNDARVAARAREMTRAGAITVADSEQAETKLHQDELAVRKARRDLELTRITAPFAGVVTERTARPRRLVSPCDTLFRVTATAPLLARVRVPEGSTDHVRIGAPARVIALNGAGAAAKVIRASPAIDAASGTREVVLELAKGSSLEPGATVTVRLGSERRRVVAVPRDALGEDGYALVWESGRTALRAVTIGADLGDGRVEVLSGLAPGERIVRGGGAR